MGIQSALERRESARDPDATFLGLNTPIITAQARGMNCLVLQLLVSPICCAWLQKRSLLAVPSRDFWSVLFLEKLLAKTHTGIELCSFGKKTILPHLKHTAYTHSHLLNDLACPSTTCDPTLLSSVPRGGGDQSVTQSWNFQSVSWAGICLGIKWVGTRLCGCITGDALLSPLHAQPTLFPQWEVNLSCLFSNWTH